MKYSEVIGQQDIKERFQKMIESDRLPHALMLCGARGYGKMALALALASYLLGEREVCENANAEAMLRKWQHPDLHFVFPVIKPSGSSADRKVTSDDFIRDWVQMLNETVYFSYEEWLERMNTENQQAQIFEAEAEAMIRKLNVKSSMGGYKVCLVWLPEKMNKECANKMLKLLEEPPQKTVFIMVCERPEALLETIRSRVQRIDVKRIDVEAVEAALVERRGLTQEDAHRIARLSNGSWLSAINALDANNEEGLFLNMFQMLMRYAYGRKTLEMKSWSETVAGFGREKQKRMLAYFIGQVRENFMFNFGNPELVYQTQEEENFSRNFARFVNEGNVIELMELFQRAIRDINQNANAKVLFYDLALKTIVLIVRR